MRVLDMQKIEHMNFSFRNLNCGNLGAPKMASFVFHMLDGAVNERYAGTIDKALVS
jgi:hypothetical protein